MLNIKPSFKKKYPGLFHKPIFIPDRAVVRLGKTIKTKNIIQNLSYIIPNLVVSKNTTNYRIITIGSPGRLTRFAFDSYEFAHILKYSQGIDINTIFCGIIRDDASIIRESTLTVLRSINLSFCLILGNFNWQFTGALESNKAFSYSKAELIKSAIKNDLPLEKAWSCDTMGIFQCGTCPSCIHRKEAFASIKVKDKTVYLPEWFSKITDVNKIKSFLLKLWIDKKPIKEHAKKFHLKISNLSKVSLSPPQEIAWEKIEDITYILNKKTGFIETLNETGAFIFEEIAKKKIATIGQIAKILVKRYQIKNAQAQKDTIFFIIKAVKKGYLKIN